MNGLFSFSCYFVIHLFRSVDHEVALGSDVYLLHQLHICKSKEVDCGQKDEYHQISVLLIGIREVVGWHIGMCMWLSLVSN